MTKKNAAKKAARARKAEHGGKYERYLREERGPDATGPVLPKGLSTHYLDAEGRLLPDDPSLPQAEVVNVTDFDATNFDRTGVVDAAYHDPKMKRDPSWPKDIKRVPSLNEYIAAREKQTGWRLTEVRPFPALDPNTLFPSSPVPLTPFVPMLTLIWDRQSKKGAER